ncbi:hypothetical protein TSOC_006186, partial [Tetrabaena socialis]
MFGRMHAALTEEGMDPRMSLVVATPHGLRLPGFVRVFMESIFEHQVSSLAEFSARGRDPLEPSNTTAEGHRIRCFKEVTLCKFHNRQGAGLCSAGAHLLHHYADRLPPTAPLIDPGADSDALKVVFASRPNATGRSILNEADLLAACAALDPAAELGAEYGGPYRRLKCVAHAYGRDLMLDMALAQVTDVLVATHGAAGSNSFLLARGASYLEVLPYRFSPAWANVYYARMLELDRM